MAASPLFPQKTGWGGEGHFRNNDKTHSGRKQKSSAFATAITIFVLHFDNNKKFYLIVKLEKPN
jgi:hypothetical protein